MLAGEAPPARGAAAAARSHRAGEDRDGDGEVGRRSVRSGRVAARTRGRRVSNASWGRVVGRVEWGGVGGGGTLRPKGRARDGTVCAERGRQARRERRGYRGGKGRGRRASARLCGPRERASASRGQHLYEKSTNVDPGPAAVKRIDRTAGSLLICGAVLPCAPQAPGPSQRPSALALDARALPGMGAGRRGRRSLPA